MSNIFAKVSRRECKVIEDAQNIYEARVKERVAFVKSFLDKGFKFNKNTALILDADKRKYGKSVKESQNYHKKYLQFQVGNYVSSGETVAKAKEKVKKNYERLLKKITKHRMDDLWTSYLNAFSKSLL